MDNKKDILKENRERVLKAYHEKYKHDPEYRERKKKYDKLRWQRIKKQTL